MPGVLIPLGLLLPAFVWILLDRAPFSGDESVYARPSLELFRTLLASPLEWPRRALDIFPLKPNALIWIGQGFVPAGYLLRSVDKGLLLSVWTSQLLTVIIVYLAMVRLSKRDSSTAVLGSLIVASAPMFVVLGGYYMVESIQMLAVAWFILIMARAGTWDPAYTLSHLLAAAAFACLTKVTTPLFCVWPGLLALVTAVRRSEAPDAWRWRQPRVAAMAVGSLCLATVAVTWYCWNWTSVVAHARVAAIGPVAAAWGKEDTFLNTLWFWLQEVGHSFFLVPLVGLSVVLLFVVAACSRKGLPTQFDHASLVAALQMATVLGAFSLSSNRSSRYLLPVLPYVGILLCWSVHRIQSRVITRLAVMTFGLQLAFVYATVFGLVPNHFNAPLRGLDHQGNDARLLESVVARSCPDEGPVPYLNVVAIDPNFRGDWLAPEPANYVAARDRAGRASKAPCGYGYLGGNFFGSGASKAWDALIAEGVRYVITVDPGIHPVPVTVFNEALRPENFQHLWTNLNNSGFFAREMPLAEDPGIVVFRRLGAVGHGRALSDQGRHEQAIDELSRTTVLEPTNVEAWANLQLAYERQGSFEQAVDAGMQARHLNAHHYYVNIGLARAFAQLKQWTDAAAHAEDAVVDAPGVPEQVGALAVAGRSRVQVGDQKRGCDLLQRAADLQPSRALQDELAGNGCGR